MKEKIAELKLRILKVSAPFVTPATKTAFGFFLFIVGMWLVTFPAETYGCWMRYLPQSVERQLLPSAIILPFTILFSGFSLLKSQIEFFRKNRKGGE